MFAVEKNLFHNRRSGDRLSGHASKWLSALPEEVRPYLLADVRPRIINQMALHWQDEAFCNAYLHDLIFNPNGAMPHPISVYWMRELVTLYNYKFNEGKTVRTTLLTHSGKTCLA